ncbi:MAG: GNAT family N-acetyltransferase [Candidatus Heimdallarchaeaceae archaeon]
MSSLADVGSPFIGKKVKLRALEEEDLSEIMKYWNTFETRIGLGTFIPESSHQREEWIKKMFQEREEGSGYTFTILNKETEEFLGTCSLRRINKVSKTAFLSVAIHNPANHNKGYGTDTVKLLLKIGFDVLNLHRIELHVYDFLKSAIHIYKKLGFKEVGRRRKASYILGEYRDDIVMDILEEEYRSLNLKNV